jgi:RNA polymerase-binding transcription factor DksA
MDTDTLEQLRSRLEQARADDQARLDEIEVRPADDSAHTMEDGEAGDAHRAKAMRQQEEQASLHEETARRLAAVDRALDRIDDGTYGTCEVCGADISEERLDALPMTARCREHAPTEDSR